MKKFKDIFNNSVAYLMAIPAISAIFSGFIAKIEDVPTDVL